MNSNLNHYFTADKSCGKKLLHLDVGNYSFPTGEILVRDPLVYLTKDEAPYLTTIPAGIFPYYSVVQFEEDHYLYVRLRLKIKETKAVVYTEAVLGNEDLEGVEEANS